MENLQVFNYGEIPVRTVTLDGEPWWVLADVCRVLEIKNYMERHLVENLFLKLKVHRRFSTRYEKRADSFFAVSLLAAILVWIA